MSSLGEAVTIIAGLITIIVALATFYGLLRAFIKDTIKNEAKTIKEYIQEQQDTHKNTFNQGIEIVAGKAQSNSDRIARLEKTVYHKESPDAK